MKDFNIEGGRGGIGARGVMEGQQTASSSSPPHSPSTTNGSSGSSPPHQTLKKTQELKLKVEYGESIIFINPVKNLWFIQLIYYYYIILMRCGGVYLLLPVKTPNPIFVFFFFCFSFISPLTSRFLPHLP